MWLNQIYYFAWTIKMNFGQINVLELFYVAKKMSNYWACAAL